MSNEEKQARNPQSFEKTTSSSGDATKNSTTDSEPKSSYSAFQRVTPTPAAPESEDQKRVTELEEENRKLQDQVNHLLFEAD